MKLGKTTLGALILGSTLAGAYSGACSGSTPNAPAEDSGAPPSSDSGATTPQPDAAASGDATTILSSGDAESSLLCTSSSACADAGACCLTSGGSACQASPCTTYQLCSRSTDCPSGDSCQPVTNLGYGVCVSAGADDSGSDSSADTGAEDAGDAGTGSDAGDGA
jgi:hypothetical protein